MKKLTYLFTSLIIVALIVSCSKDAANDDNVMLKGAIPYGINTPTSDNGEIPEVIPGENRGGNRTCTDVASYYHTSFDYCDVKRNYNYVDTDGDGIQDTYEFDGPFPIGIEVTVDGIYISFVIDGCILMEGKYYKVGAVIVKGGNAANVYYYPEGTLEDGGLAAPGEKPMVSNLTFCFIECEEQPDLVIAVKSYMTSEWACTSTEDISFVGYYDFIPNHVGYKIYYIADMTVPVGNLQIGNFDDDALLEVRIDNSDMSGLLFTNAYLYVGTLAGYNPYNYLNFPYKRLDPISPTASVTFDLPF